MRQKIRDLSGNRFGMLTVNKFFKKDVSGGYIRYLWECLCDCGNIKIVDRCSLAKGDTRSCGCMQKEKCNSIKHGLSGHRLYGVWNGIKTRCFNTKSGSYHNYGGRGITMDVKWVNSFQSFYNDLISIYKPGYTCERIDNNGNYELSNIEFIPRCKQSLNMRTNILVSINEITKHLTHWCKELKISHATVYRRVREGVSYEEALTSPVLRKYPRPFITK